MREQVVDGGGRMRLDAEQNIREVEVGIDVVFLARRYKCVEHGEMNAGLLVGYEKKVGAPEGNAAQGGFGGIVVRRNGVKAQKASKRFAMAQKITHRFSHERAWLVGITVASRPAKKARKERARA